MSSSFLFVYRPSCFLADLSSVFCNPPYIQRFYEFSLGVENFVEVSF